MLNAPALISPSRQALYRRLAACLAMLAVAIVYRADHLTDWDSWDYAAQAIQGHSSDLLLGRWWFIAIMRLAVFLGQSVWGYDAFNIEQAASSAYIAMQTCSAVMMGLALMALMAWTYRLTKSVAAEVVTVALILPGPLIGIYASSVMTESLTVLMLSLTFWAWEAAIRRKSPDESQKASLSPGELAFLAGCAFGVAIDVREPAAMFCAWPVLSCLTDRPAHRWRLLGFAALGTAVTLGIGVMGGWLWYPWLAKSYFQNMVSWTGMMASERQQFQFSPWSSFQYIKDYALAASPVAAMLILPAAAWSLVRRSRLGWLFLGCVPYTLSLVMNHDLSVNPRFLIPLIWILSPVISGSIAGLLLGGQRWYRLRLAGVTMAVAGWGLYILMGQWSVWMEGYYFRYATSMHEVFDCLMHQVPDKSVIIPGPSTPVVMHINRLRLRDYDLIASGWAWRDNDLKRIIDNHLARGQRVYINNISEQDWSPGARKNKEWGQLMRAIQGYRYCQGTYPLVRILPPLPETTSTPTSTPASAPAGTT